MPPAAPIGAQIPEPNKDRTQCNDFDELQKCLAYNATPVSFSLVGQDTATRCLTIVCRVHAPCETGAAAPMGMNGHRERPVAEDGSTECERRTPLREARAIYTVC